MTVLEEVGAHGLYGIIPEHSKQSTVSCQNVYEHFASLMGHDLQSRSNR